MSGSRTIIDDKDRLRNVHPGDVLREDFLIGIDIPAAEVAAGARIEAAVLDEVLANRRDIDAELDLRLARYFGVSDGFFLRLQLAHDLEEVRRRRGADIDRIEPRAA